MTARQVLVQYFILSCLSTIGTKLGTIHKLNKVKIRAIKWLLFFIITLQKDFQGMCVQA